MTCAALALAACGGSEDENAYEVGVMFKSTKPLPLEDGAPVRIDGKEVGRAATAGDGPVAGTQLVILRIDEGAAPLPFDSAFRIRDGAVEVKPGRSRAAREGTYFSYKQTYPVE